MIAEPRSLANKKPPMIIFDLDGTLVPTMQGFADIAGTVIQDLYGWNAQRARQAYLATSGIPFFQQLEVLFPKDSRNADAAESFESEKENFFRRVRMDHRVRDALRTLKQWGIKLIVSSNNFERLVQSMIQRECPSIFDSVLGYRDGFAKGKDHFDFLQREFGIHLPDCVFVGDSLSDYSKAKQFKIPFIGITGTFSVDEFKALSPSIQTTSSVAHLPSFFEFSPAQRAEMT